MCSLCSFSLYYCINYNLQTVSDQWLRIDIFLAEILQFLLHFWFEYIKYIFWSERWIYYIEHEMACGCWKWMVYIFGMTDLKCKALKFSVLEVKKKKNAKFFITCRRKANLYLLAFCNDITQILPVNKKWSIKGKKKVCFSFYWVSHHISF